MPIPGRASTSADAPAGECIGDCVILTVDMTNGPGAAGGRELFPKVVAFFQKSEEMLAVATPQTRHHHDYKERIQFKNCRLRRLAQGLAKAFAETKKFRDVVGRRFGADDGCAAGSMPAAHNAAPHADRTARNDDMPRPPSARKRTVICEIVKGGRMRAARRAFLHEDPPAKIHGWSIPRAVHSAK